MSFQCLSEIIDAAGYDATKDHAVLSADGRCAGCGWPSDWLTCRECDVREALAQQAAEAVRTRLAKDNCTGIPAGYEWVRPAPEARDILVERIQLRSDLKTTVAEILASTVSTLVGQSGMGKTSLAIAALRKSAQGGSFAMASEIVRDLRNTRLGVESELMQRIHRAPVLVLDELKPIGSATFSGPIEDLIWERVANKRTTIVTTGMTEMQVLNEYGDGMRRRLFGDGLAKVVRLGGPAMKAVG